MSKPGGDPSSGISSVDVLRPTERHPACRQREARPGCRMERENLASDAKGKGASGSNREAESTDAPERGGLPRRRAASSSDCVARPRERGIGLSGFAVQIRPSSLTGSYVMATAEHREPYESRGSRTVLGAPGGESPPGDSPIRASTTS